MIQIVDMKGQNSLKADKREKVKELFSGWEETLIWSCLQGLMGRIYVNKGYDVISAAAEIGDIIFFAGQADQELVKMNSYWTKKEYGILVPQNLEWKHAIETCYGGKARKYTRYAFKKEKDIFDVNKLETIVHNLSGEYELQSIDRNLYEICKTLEYGMDWVSQFPDYASYEKSGLGFVVLKEGVPIAGASSYTRYKDGIEVQIDTKPEYQRQGLALICGAALILECLKRGLYPSWDAQNIGSVHLAEKLGYHCSHEYTAYEVNK